MRNQVVLFLLFMPVLSFAAPKEVDVLKLESQTARETLSKSSTTAPTFAEVAQKLRDFEASLTATIQDYEKQNPTEGDSREEKVVKFSYRFEPVFALLAAKPDKAACEKTRAGIEFEDKSGKDEDAALTENAEEALKWLALLCG